MKLIKITKEQAKMLESMRSPKLLKITKEQLAVIQGMERMAEANPSDQIPRDFEKAITPKENRFKFKKTLKKIDKIRENQLWEEFINELYGINEGENGKYSKLINLLEAIGVVENRRIKKEAFNGNKDMVKVVLECGLYEMTYGGDELTAIREIESGIDLSRDRKSSDDVYSELVSKWLETNSNPRVQHLFDSGRHKDAWLALRRISNKVSEASNYPAGAETHPNAPFNQPDTEAMKNPKDSKYTSLWNDDEFSVVTDGKNRFLISHDEYDTDEYAPYANIHWHTEEDEDGFYKVPSDDYWYSDIDALGEGVIGFINDNIDNIPVIKNGFDAYESGEEGLLYIDDKLKKELTLLSRHMKDKTGFLNAINGVSEVTTAASSGAFVAPLSGGQKHKSNVSDEMNKIIDEEELDETTTVASAGGASGTFAYDTPGFVASEFMGTKGKNGKAPVKKNGGKMLAYDKGKFVHENYITNKLPEHLDSFLFHIKSLLNIDLDSVFNFIRDETKDVVGILQSYYDLFRKFEDTESIRRSKEAQKFIATIKGSSVNEDAMTDTQYPEGGFVELDDCVKLNNNKKAQGGGCSTGAVDNVVKVRKSKNSVISDEALYYEIALKTGRPINEVVDIISKIK